MRGGGTRKRNVMRGGNLGNTFALGPPILGNNAATVTTGSSCLARTPDGFIQSFTPKGLPGMGGGGRRRKQRGGRYTAVLEPLAPGLPGLGAPAGAGRIPCEAAVANPLNPVQMGGVGGVGSEFYAAKTAGYTNMPSTWVSSTGTPSLLQTPYDARTTPPVCSGGGRRKIASRRKKAPRRKKASRRKGTRRH